MKNKYTKIALIGVIVLIFSLMFINKSLQLPKINALPEAEGGHISQDRQSGNTDAIREEIRDVNPSALKNLGDLAFCRDGFLYVIEGKTGEIRQLTQTGRALFPRWSYDGKYLAFIRITDQKAMTGALWIVDREGKGAYQVQGVSDTLGADDFKWSPTQNTLAVGGFGSGIWIVPVKDKPQSIVETDSPVWVAWSPDGKRLAYNVTKGDPQTEQCGDILYIYDVDSGKSTPQLDLSQTGAGIEVAEWWPDGKGLLFWGNFALHSASLRADGLGLVSLKLGEKEPKNIACTLAYTDWLSFLPDGRLLIVKGCGRTLWMEKDIAIADVKTGKVEDLKNVPGHVTFDPAISPDGTKIAFIAAKEMEDSVFYEDQDAWFESRTLWVCDADGSNPRRLENAGTNVYQPMWSKDGSHILYAKDEYIWLIDANDTKPEQVLRPSLSKEEYFGFYGYTRFTDQLSWFR